MVWLAPVPTNSWGRSALMTSRGIPAASASLTAGWRLETAVPEVVTTAAHRLAPVRAWARAAPSAMKPALRSSRTTRRLRAFASAASARASASGALRDPGHRTASRTPSSRRAATRLRASARAGGICGRSTGSPACAAMGSMTESVTGARIRERTARSPLLFITVRAGSHASHRGSPATARLGSRASRWRRACRAPARCSRRVSQCLVR